MDSIELAIGSVIGLGVCIWLRRRNSQYPLHNVFDLGGSDSEDTTAALLQVFQALVATGADVNARNNNGETTLFRTGEPEVFQALVAAGADVNARDNDGKTALMLARENNRLELVRLLIMAGADESNDFTASMEEKSANPLSSSLQPLSVGETSSLLKETSERLRSSIKRSASQRANED